MKCSSPEKENEHWINIVVPEKMEIPPDYFNKEWAKELIEKNQIDEPFNGLHNLGNSCFLNSVIQCLAYTPGLEKFASTLPNVIYENCSGKPCFLHHFGQLCKAMRVMRDPAPHIFFANLNKVSPEMECGSQQDAHEYLFALINRFDDECSLNKGKALTTENTPMTSFFGGTFREERTCSKCEHVDNSSSKFLDITLPLDADTIEGCFENFMAPRNVGSNYICEHCKETGTCSTKTVFSETPNILVVTMMRFTTSGVKNETQVDFGLNLDLTPFVEPGAFPYYELFAVINHSGHQINRGHFTCFVKCSNSWYSADDSKVVKESSQAVLESRPYVLFYKRHYGSVLNPVMVSFGIPNKEKKRVMPKSASLPAPTHNHTLRDRDKIRDREKEREKEREREKEKEKPTPSQRNRNQSSSTMVQTTLSQSSFSTRSRDSSRSSTNQTQPTVTFATGGSNSSRRRAPPANEEVADQDNEHTIEPKNAYDGFFSEASDGESDLIADGMMRVEKVVSRPDNTIVTVQFVCEKRKK